MYDTKKLVLYPNWLETSNMDYNNETLDHTPLWSQIWWNPNVAILNLKPLKNLYYFERSNGNAGLCTREADTAADSIKWEVIARKSVDLHESLLLIYFYLNCKQKSEYIL